MPTDVGQEAIGLLHLRTEPVERFFHDLYRALKTRQGTLDILRSWQADPARVARVRHLGSERP